MHTCSRGPRTAAIAGGLIAVAILATLSSSASALAAGRAVFVQTDNPAGNQIVAYERAGDGTLAQAGTYATEGLGGVLEGSVVDHLASQGALAYDAQHRLLYAVNAGSDTISVFAVFGDRLALRQVIASGGSFPASVAVSDGLVYVLNALEGGTLQGFRVIAGRLQPIPGSSRALGLNASATPQYTNTPGQVAFSPGGAQLLVTTKENGNDVDVFAVDPLGRLSKAPVVSSLAGTVPFATAFDREGHLLVAEAAGALASFVLRENGTLAQLDSAPTGQTATCWIVGARGRFYTSNAGSASLSGFQVGARGGLLTLFSTTGTSPGPVDAAATGNGRFIYLQAGGEGVVDEFAVEHGGALDQIGSVTVPDAVGGEGIVAP
jgi:6-phosphogluconolactonase (cycloisomerase 2 family)